MQRTFTRNVILHKHRSTMLNPFSIDSRFYTYTTNCFTGHARTPKVYFVLGGPGSGKGTQCEKLAKKEGFSHLCAGELLRNEVASGSETGVMVRTLMTEGKIVPGHITIGLLKREIEAHPESAQFLIDGFPREIQQAMDFEKQVIPCERVIFIDCPEEILEQRLLQRGKTSGRIDDNLVSIRKRFKTHQDQTLPVIQYYESQGKLITIDGSKTVAQVEEQLKHAIALSV